MEKLYSIRECANMVGVKYNRVRWWVTNNEVPCGYVGNHPTFTEAQVEAVKARLNKPKEKKPMPFIDGPHPEVLDEKSGIVAIGVAADALGLNTQYVKRNYRELGLTPLRSPRGHLRFDAEQVREIAQKLLKMLP